MIDIGAKGINHQYGSPRRRIHLGESLSSTHAIIDLAQGGITEKNASRPGSPRFHR